MFNNSELSLLGSRDRNGLDFLVVSNRNWWVKFKEKETLSPGSWDSSQKSKEQPHEQDMGLASNRTTSGIWTVAGAGSLSRSPSLERSAPKNPGGQITWNRHGCRSPAPSWVSEPLPAFQRLWEPSATSACIYRAVVFSNIQLWAQTVLPRGPWNLQLRQCDFHCCEWSSAWLELPSSPNTSSLSKDDWWASPLFITSDGNYP